MSGTTKSSWPRAPLWVAGLLGIIVGSEGLFAQAEQGQGGARQARPVLTREVVYRDGETECEGFLAWREDRKNGPLILIFHDWMGRGAFDEAIARRLAAAGYVAFCADVYGKGIRPKDATEARKESMGWYADRDRLRRRLAAALEAARAESSAPAGAIGYCFGGTCALELARSGAALTGAVSFHGGLTTPVPARAETLKSKLLVLHGADDPFVPPADVTAFMEEMRTAKADWQLVAYGNAVHSFTNPAAGKDKNRGAAYDEAADRRSWRAMLAFFEEVSGQGQKP